jgi:hypothetical protein
VPQDLPEWFIEKARAVTAKRAKTVIDHILKHGYITTEELKNLYGYNHPPRAARDVREQGIPRDTFRITGNDGRSLGAYRFADPSKIRAGTLAGRKVFSKEFKEALVVGCGCKCGVCLTQYEARYLQVDHRVPYEVGGEGGGETASGEFQLICGSCNRAKSWSCEHCTNWTERLDPNVCKTCYWASPESYKHIAMRPIRRLELVWTDNEVADFDKLSKAAQKRGLSVPDFINVILREKGA